MSSFGTAPFAVFYQVIDWLSILSHREYRHGQRSVISVVEVGFMATTPQEIDSWRQAPSEHQHLEFKEAKNQYDFKKLCEYCVGIANEGGGNLLLGIADRPPRDVVGTNAFPNPVKTEKDIYDKLSFRVGVEEVMHPDGRVLVFDIPPRPQGTAYHLDGKYMMRVGEALVPMTEDQLRSKFDEREPDWNKNAHASALVIANLLGGWDENNDADIEIVSHLVRLSSLETDAWIASLREVLQLAASPLALKNGKWSVKDRKSLWQALGSRVYDSYLSALEQCAIQVLSERDPKFELPKEERYLAIVHEKVLRHSPELRQGMAESLAVLGTQPSVLNHCSLHRPESTVVMALRGALEDADWVLWGSLDRLLPTLAEASPDEFLRAIEHALQQSPCPLDELFSQETPGILYGATYLTGLLWALEALAWDEILLVRACVILGKLAERDPGGNWLNRPARSLRTILLPWLPQTTAPVEKRKSALETLMRESPDVAWKLLLSLLPGQTQSSEPTYKPRWRNTIPDSWTKDVDNKEYREYVDVVASLTIEVASHEMERLEDLIGQLNSLPPEVLDQAINQLFPDDPTAFPEDQQTKFWHKVTNFIRTQKREQAQFPESTVPLDDELIARIESIAATLAPQDPSHLHRWLFNHQSVFYIEEEGNWEEKRKILGERQREAVDDILSYGGVDAVIRFAENVEVSGSVGYSLGSVADLAIDARILPRMLDSEIENHVWFTSYYVDSRYRKDGWGWVDGIDRSQWSPSQTGQFLSYLPFGQETWNRASGWLTEIESEYWSRPNTRSYLSGDDLNFAMGNFTHHGNPTAAIQCLYNLVNDSRPINTALAKQALLAAGKSGKVLDSGQIAHIIRALQDDPNMDQDDLFEIEWFYLPLFDSSEGLMKTIGNRLASDPSLFCEAIRLIYLPEGKEKPTREVAESDKQLATRVYGLLQGWRIPPGTQRDGTFSPDSFEEWLSQVKTICEESGHLGVAQSQIGQVLIHSPCDPDGFWLHRTVASALDDEDAQRMRDGYRIGTSNSRGAHTIDPTGKPERELAEKQRRKAEEIEKAGYHRLATTFRELAEDYEREADRVIDRYGEQFE